MEFIGPEDYYFWEGVERGQVAPRSAVEGLLEELPDLRSSVMNRCREAYLWGFLWGLRLTSMEYHDMINPEIKAPVVDFTPKEKEPAKALEPDTAELDDDNNKEWPLKGNC